jgi:hypothetical protein
MREINKNNITIKDFMSIATITETFKNNPDAILRELVKYFKIDGMVYKDSLDFIKNIMEEISVKDYEFYKTFKYKGVDYGFIPNLDEITVGEYLDIDQYQKIDGSIHKLMSILYRPIVKKIGKDYKIEEYNGTKNSDDFLELPVIYYFGAMVFFCRLRNVL